MREGGVLHLEPEVPAAIADELKKRGHRIEPAATAAYGGYQAIWRDPATGIYAGATERRKDGCAMGY
jgi:gamma-glutamyltranspeptidase/glutathione hydrolase